MSKTYMTYKTYLLMLCFVAFGVFLALRAASSPPLIEPSQKTSTVKGAKSSYDLIETTTREFTGGSDIATYQPVTISHKVAQGDSLASIATKYHADAQTIVDYPYNDIPDNLTLEVGQILIIPNGYIDSAPPPPPVAKGSGILAWPAFGPISQYAYWWHAGAIDIVSDTGSPVLATDNGKVIAVEKLTTGYGWHIVLDHQTGLTSLYAHLSQIDVTLNQKISKGQVLGSVGATGRSTGSHLHFEVKQNGQPIDPMSLLPPI